eukprot:TRINITY_DN1210_c0_g1_i6.p1 TRINITY_DN1210_c0_g1~~TRINITY_DN1210_c0_g1_i6.p1  ORF type:complete len:406 (+),score=55.56 TRINITY_DN1210_c0_g1_i6:391-1608(+)
MPSYSNTMQGVTEMLNGCKGKNLGGIVTRPKKFKIKHPLPSTAFLILRPTTLGTGSATLHPHTPSPPRRYPYTIRHRSSRRCPTTFDLSVPSQNHLSTTALLRIHKGLEFGSLKLVSCIIMYEQHSRILLLALRKEMTHNMPVSELPRRIELPEEWREKIGIRLQEAEEIIVQLVERKENKVKAKSMFKKVKEDIRGFVGVLHNLVNGFVREADAVVDERDRIIDMLRMQEISAPTPTPVPAPAPVPVAAPHCAWAVEEPEEEKIIPLRPLKVNTMPSVHERLSKPGTTSSKQRLRRKETPHHPPAPVTSESWKVKRDKLAQSSVARRLASKRDDSPPPPPPPPGWADDDGIICLPDKEDMTSSPPPPPLSPSQTATSLPLTSQRGMMYQTMLDNIRNMYREAPV